MVNKTTDQSVFLNYRSYICHLRGNKYSFIHSFTFSMHKHSLPPSLANATNNSAD